jgi:hypothetical protein
MRAFDDMLTAVAAKPALYVGKTSLGAVANFIAGYGHALSDLGQPNPHAVWNRWVELKFLISHPAWHWTRILLHIYGNDRAALDALPTLHAEFRAFVGKYGADDIDAEHYRRFVAAYGTQSHEPKETRTSPSL